MYECRWCGQPVTVAGGDAEYGRAVHGDGREQCADGKHLAAPMPVAAGAR